MKIYVASSWRNPHQPMIVEVLRSYGHDVYDFKNPEPGNKGFAWGQIDPDWQRWGVLEYRAALQHSIAVKAYGHDIRALQECDACVLVLPSGRSASWEFGYAMAQGKACYVLQLESTVEPELMYQEAEILGSIADLYNALGRTRRVEGALQP